MRLLAILKLIVVGIIPCVFGGVTTLTDLNYDELVTNSKDLWLLEFYAPWCGHCKRLRPVLDELAQDESPSRPMQVGVMDATAEKTTPGKFGIKSYPTIKYFRDGVYGKYEGPRTIEGFRTFRERMHGPAFHVLESEANLKDLLNTSPVVFVLRTTTTTGSSGSSSSREIPSLFQAVAKQNQAQATFAVIQSSGGMALSFSKVEGGKHTKYMNIDGIDWGNTANNDMDRLGDFVKGNNYPLVASLDSHNFKHLGSLKRTMVIAVVDYKDAGQSKKLLDDLDAAATTLPLEQAENFVFGHLDGVQWKGFVKQYEAKVPALLLLDIAKEKYHTTLCDKDFSADSITSILAGLTSGNVTMKATPSKGFLQDIKKKLVDYYPYSLLCLLPIVLIIVSMLLYYPDESKAKKE